MGVQEVITSAEQQIGKWYEFGAMGPNTFDCSGLICYAYKHGANKTLPHFTGTMVTVGTKVTKDQLIPGDLVFPDTHHVQLYVGGGMVIEAPHTGARVRKVKMWGFWTARRVIGGGEAVTGSVVGVSNPLVPDSVEKLAGFLGDGSTWVRAGWYLAGALLILIGIVLLATDATPGVSSVAQLAGKVSK